MVEVMKIRATSFKRSHAGTAALSAPTLQQATADPRLHRRLLHTHRQVNFIKFYFNFIKFLPITNKILPIRHILSLILASIFLK